MYGSLTWTLLVLLARTISEISQPTIPRIVRFSLESRNKFSDSTLVSTVDKFEEIHARYTHISLSLSLSLSKSSDCISQKNVFCLRRYLLFFSPIRLSKSVGFTRLLVETISYTYRK